MIHLTLEMPHSVLSIPLLIMWHLQDSTVIIRLEPVLPKGRVLKKPMARRERRINSNNLIVIMRGELVLFLVLPLEGKQIIQPLAAVPVVVIMELAIMRIMVKDKVMMKMMAMMNINERRSWREIDKLPADLDKRRKSGLII